MTVVELCNWCHGIEHCSGFYLAKITASGRAHKYKKQEIAGIGLLLGSHREVIVTEGVVGL